jgi:hypothetical protein
MMDATGMALIERQIRRDSRSLLQYVCESFPYTPASAELSHAQVFELAREEQEALARLVRFMHRHHVSPPVLGAFPSHFTTINFVSLEHLLPPLLKEQRFAVAELERALATLPESDARHVLWEYLELKRRHVQALEGGAHASATAPVHHSH